MDVNQLTISKVSVLLREREISVKELVEEYLKRIKTIDQGERGLNSILEINPDALSIAQKLDRNQEMRGSMLYGVPILLKDNIDTADRMHTSAGSLALEHSIAAEDAKLVHVLREKGALILGKTNMTEFANYMTKGMPAGYSSRGGQVKSPYQWGKDPGGSSTGSAVALTASLCTASIGTDTSGSIISPSMNNSIVGFRPSMGSISQKGIIPISFTCDMAGPMTKTVRDSSILYSELTRNISAPIEGKKKLSDLTIAINEWALKNMNAEEEKKARDIVKALEKENVVIKRISIESIPMENIKTIQRYEFKYAINRYLERLPKEFPIHSLQDIIAFNNRYKEQTLVYGQDHLMDAMEHTSGDLKEAEYIAMLNDREVQTNRIHEQLKDVDICIMFSDNLRMQYTGLPVITIPHGLYNDGMPYGIVMTALNDVALLHHAEIVEELIADRVEPTYK